MQISEIKRKYERLYLIFTLIVFFLHFVFPSISKALFDFDISMNLHRNAGFSFIFTFASVWIVIQFVAELFKEKEKSSREM